MIAFAHRRKRVTRAFTLVEIIVIIGVIAILTSLAIVGYGSVQQSSRDAARSSNATVISEALEKYYDKHGEYPSCTQLTQDPTTVSESVLIGIDKDALQTPTGDAANAIACDDLTSTEDGDYFAYVGDESESCVSETGSACVTYTLKYIQEASGDIAAVNSRRETTLNSNVGIVLTATTDGVGQVKTSWNSYKTALKYDVQYSNTVTFPALTDTNTVNAGSFEVTSAQRTISGLQQGALYYFRVRAVTATGPGNWSATQTATTWALTTPSLTRSSNATSITTSWASITHATDYTIQYATANTFTSPESYTITGTNHTLTLPAQSERYVRVRANANGQSSTWSSTLYQVAIPTATAPSVSAAGSTTTSASFSWSSIAYANSYEYQSRINDGSWSSTQSTTSTSAAISSSNGAKVELRVRTVNAISTSDWSSVATNYLAPAAPSVSYGSVTTSSITFNWTAISNASRYEYQTQTNSGTWSSTSSQTGTSKALTSTTEGTKLGIRVRAVNPNNVAGAWSTVSERNLDVNGPSWNKWNQSSSYPTWSFSAALTDGSNLCGSGLELYTRARSGAGSFGSWSGYSNRGVNAKITATYSVSNSSYSSYAYMQIGGYCRNATTGATSSTLTTSEHSAKHPAPNVTLSGPTTCAGTYSGRSAFALRVTVNEVSYNLDANQSNVNWSIYRYANNSGWKSYDQTKTWPWGVNVDGQGWSGSSNSSKWRYTASTVGSTETIASGTKTVTHNSDGRKTISFSGYDGTSSSKSSIFGTGSCSGSYVLSDLR